MPVPRKHDDNAPPVWIAAAISHNLPEAHIILGKLRAHDIPAMLHQEAGATALGITYGNLGEIKILVSPADYDAAAELLHIDDSPQLEDSNADLRVIWQDDDDAE